MHIDGDNRKGRTFSPVFASGNPNHPLSLFVLTVMHSILTHYLLYRVPIMSGNGLGPGDTMTFRNYNCVKCFQVSARSKLIAVDHRCPHLVWVE